MSENEQLIDQGREGVLGWGVYPLEDEPCNDCDYTTRLVPPDPLMVDKYDSYKSKMAQREGNNTYFFQDRPDYTKYNVGIGCYNDSCQCDKCHGSCFCDNHTDTLLPPDDDLILTDDILLVFDYKTMGTYVVLGILLILAFKFLIKKK